MTEAAVGERAIVSTTSEWAFGGGSMCGEIGIGALAHRVA